jgi:hypothetical protein
MDTPIHLQSLGGGEAPPDLPGDLRRLLRLPPAALSKLWQVLEPCVVVQDLSEETSRLLDVFCAAHRIDTDELGRVIKSCRFLIGEAARRDLSEDQLRSDLEALCPDTLLIHEVLLVGYGRAKAAIRQGLAVAALVGHGKLLLGADWRLDTIQTSAQGAKLGVSVAMLTLHYREGQENRRITLQVLPDMMGQLKGICEQVLS